MFCPRCGQQAAEGVSFCSRCGLPLDAAAALVETGGAPADEAEAGGAVSALTPRQRGLRKGIIYLLAGVLFFVIAGVLTTIKEDLFVLLVPAGIAVVLGFMRILYALLLEAHASPRKKAGREADARAGLGRAAARAGELPPAQSIPASVYAKPAADTSDISAPPSVTENTTKLLGEQKRER